MTSAALESQTVATGYNGWCNRETWVVNLWLTNDECYYEELQAIIKTSIARSKPKSSNSMYTGSST
jgi:hypothetical protein